jgi:RNA polymerase sigma-70 factor (ECF subfamily)
MPQSSATPPGWVHEDKALVDEMLAGDRRSFDEFFEELVPRLYRFAAQRLNEDPDTLREVVQSTICTAIDQLENYRGEAALFSWICGICRYEILARYRSRKVTSLQVQLAEDTDEIRGALESLSRVPDLPDEALRRKEVASLVHRALDHLPRRYGRALEWKYGEGLSVKEIAERLGIGPKAAESVLSRARVAFREAFSTLLGATLETSRPVGV